MNKSKGSTNLEVKNDEDKCFVIMPISSQDGYDDEHFQLVYEDIIKPSILAANLKPSRADETKNTNLIQLDILRSIIDSPIAVCDMSAKNPNVFYELGMRQAFDMPTVLLKDETTNAPFDINGLRYVTYNKDMKHRNVVSAIEALTTALKDTYNKKDDKAEINSLIRLMELAAPAKLGQVEMSEELRHEKINELHFKEILSTIEQLSAKQSMMFNYMNIEQLRKDLRPAVDFSEGEEITKSRNLFKNKYIGSLSDDEFKVQRRTPPPPPPPPLPK